MREEANRLRAQAAKARRLAKTILLSDPASQSLAALAKQLDAEATRLEGEITDDKLNAGAFAQRAGT